MAQGKFLCFKDVNGYRGFIPPGTSYILRHVSSTNYWLEAEGVATLIKVPTPNDDCDNYGEDIGFVNDESKAMEWVLCDDNSQFIGLDT